MRHTESSSRKGDFAEYYAVTWLWDNGYEVFKNAGCSGPVDIIAMDKKGEIILIDVKTSRKMFNPDNPETVRYKNSKVRTEQQIKLGVKLLSFDPVTRKLSFVNHRSTTDEDNKNEKESINIS